MISIREARRLLRKDDVAVLDRIGGISWKFVQNVINYDASSVFEAVLLRVSQNHIYLCNLLHHAVKKRAWLCVEKLLCIWKGAVIAPRTGKLIISYRCTEFFRVMYRCSNPRDFRTCIKGSGHKLNWAMVVCHYGFKDALSMIIRHNPGSLYEHDSNEKNALMYAMESKNVSCVRMIIEQPSQVHWSMIAHAVCHSSCNIVRLLIRFFPEHLPPPDAVYHGRTTNIYELFHVCSTKWILNLDTTHKPELRSFICRELYGPLRPRYARSCDIAGVNVICEIFGQDVALNFIVPCVKRDWFVYDGDTQLGKERRKNERLVKLLRRTSRKRKWNRING